VSATDAKSVLLAKFISVHYILKTQAKLRMDGDQPYVTDNSNYIVDLYFKVASSLC
jgi:ribose 5-phosphate isomerase